MHTRNVDGFGFEVTGKSKSDNHIRCPLRPRLFHRLSEKASCFTAAYVKTTVFFKSRVLLSPMPSYVVHLSIWRKNDHSVRFQSKSIVKNATD